MIGKPILKLLNFGNAGFGRLKATETNISLLFFRICGRILKKKGQGCLKLTSEQAGIGLGRENIRIPDIRKVETLISVILDLN